MGVTRRIEVEETDVSMDRCLGSGETVQEGQVWERGTGGTGVRMDRYEIDRCWIYRCGDG